MIIIMVITTILYWDYWLFIQFLEIVPNVTIINVDKQCHKPPIWEWFIPPIFCGEIGDDLLLF